MSYILDALEKSERQRKQATAPSLTPAPVRWTLLAEPVPRALYLLAAALLVGAGMLLGWWRPWQPALPEGLPNVQAPAAEPKPPSASPPARRTGLVDPPVESVASAATPMPAPPAPAAEPTASRPAPAVLAPEAVAAAPNSPPPPASQPLPKRDTARASTARAAPDASGKNPSSVTDKPAPASKPPARLADESAPKADAASRRAAAEAEAEGKPPARVLQFSELPPAVAGRVPRINVTGYAHGDDPESRVVVINDKMLREGDQVSAGLKLERIGGDGIVLNFKGYRFRPAP